MAKKLAVTIAGAVSLGSYESGVLYEMLDAIAQHNVDPATTDADRIVIDVLTGASAGGMTAIILAQKLLFNAGEFLGPYDNPVYNVWVKRIDLEELQATQPDEPALHSLFSSDLVETISKEMLLARYANGAPPPQQRHLAVEDALRVGVALTNLNGVAYGYNVVPDGKFDYIDYGDQRTRFAQASTCDNAAFWEPLRQAAVACGAFPVAFRPQDIVRSTAEDPGDFGKNIENWDGSPRTFTYSDGGILQNQPLGMAKNLVDLIDRHLEEERFYLFVSPHAKDPSANDTFHQAQADYFHLIERLIDVVMGQSGFQDWVTALGMNDRIALLDCRAEGLKDAILAGDLDVPALAKTATSLLSLFFPDGKQCPPGGAWSETLPEAQARIAAQYASEMTVLSAHAGYDTAFRDAVLAFESAAGLGARDTMTIYGVTATDAELAGGGLQAFLGFFDQKFRDHDYDVGRTHARALLTNAALANPGGIGPIRYTGQPIHPIDASLNGLPLSAVPAADRAEFKTGTRRRVEQMVRELLGSVLALPADPVVGLLVDAIVDHLFQKPKTQSA